jgi:hypothetical protein
MTTVISLAGKPVNTNTGTNTKYAVTVTDAGVYAVTTTAAGYNESVLHVIVQ